MSPGVSTAELRAAVALARVRTGGEGVEWPPAVWERLWSRLTPTQQRVVYLHALVGLTLADVAGALDLSRGSIDGAWRRALDRIRDAIPGRRAAQSPAWPNPVRGGSIQSYHRLGCRTRA